MSFKSAGIGDGGPAAHKSLWAHYYGAALSAFHGAVLVEDWDRQHDEHLRRVARTAATLADLAMEEHEDRWGMEEDRS